jgi:DAK2 domain fusion protein YloV
MQRALTAAAEAAYAAVSEPVEGTILSVAAAAAKAARDADPADLLAVVRAAARAGSDELARTTEELPVLATAGVVDAGGQGLVVVLDALVDVIEGVDTAPEPEIAPGPVTGSVGGATFAYEVQYLLEAPTDAVPGLRARLRQLGDAVAVVTGNDLHNVHAHVDDVGAAIEAGIAVGRPSRISVTRFADQIISSRVVAVCPAGGLAALFRAAGATVIELGEDTSAVAGALTAAACATDVQSIVMLPNSRAMKELADEAARVARATGRTVTVVPTRSPVQGLAALAVHDPARGGADDAVVMSATAAATRYAEVTRAQHDALTSAGQCRAGDVLGLIDDDVAVIGDDIAVVARELLDRMLIGGGELVTIISGAAAPPSLSAELADYLQATRPAVEAVVHHGGQATYPLLLGVE